MAAASRRPFFLFIVLPSVVVAGAIGLGQIQMSCTAETPAVTPQPAAAPPTPDPPPTPPDVEIADAVKWAEIRLKAKDYSGGNNNLEVAEEGCSKIDPDLAKTSGADKLCVKAAKLRATYGKRIAKTKAKAEAEQLALENAVARCGKNEPGTSAIKSYLRSVANDPGSVSIEQCSTPSLTAECWETTCTFRGKNAFGAYVIDSATFYQSTNSDGSGGTAVVNVKQ